MSQSPEDSLDPVARRIADDELTYNVNYLGTVLTELPEVTERGLSRERAQDALLYLLHEIGFQAEQVH